MTHIILKAVPAAVTMAFSLAATSAGAATLVLDDFTSPSPAQTVAAGPGGVTIAGSGPYSRTISWMPYTVNPTATFTIGDGGFSYTPTNDTAGYANMAYGAYSGAAFSLNLDSYHFLRLDMAAAGALNLVMEFFTPTPADATNYYGTVGVNAQPNGFAYIPLDPIRSYFSFDNIAGIRFAIDQAGSGSAAYTLHQIAFTTTGAVPEPASWTLLILGFGLVGGALRRQRRTALRFG